MKCSCCRIDLEGFISHEKGSINLCHLCYKSLNQTNNNKNKNIYLRRYVYPDTYEEVMDFFITSKLRTPNYKENFPFALKQYINHLKFQAQK